MQICCTVRKWASFVRLAWHQQPTHYNYKLQHNRYTENWQSKYMEYKHSHLPGFKTWAALHKHYAGSWQSWKMLCKHINHSKFKNKVKSKVIDNKLNTVNYFPPGPSQYNDKRLSVKIMQQLQRDFKGVFTGIGYFDGTFSLQIKTGSKPYHVLPRCVAYALLNQFKKELEWLQQQDIVKPLGVDETAEWCNHFVLAANPMENSDYASIWWG